MVVHIIPVAGSVTAALYLTLERTVKSAAPSVPVIVLIIRVLFNRMFAASALTP